MNIDEILKQLETAGRKFPRQALNEAIAHRDEITPELLKILDYVDQNTEAVLDDYDYALHLYALYLLAQFRESTAYPLIVQLFSKPGEIMMELASDLVTEDLGRILASVSHGDVSLMKGMVENPALNEYIRSAALRGFVVLVNSGELSREDALAYFQELFRGRLEREFSNIWNALVSCSTDLYPDVVYEDIKQAYADELVENFYIGLDTVESTLKMGMEKAMQERQKWSRDTLITDTIDELQGWAYFQPPKPTKPRKIVLPPPPVLPSSPKTPKVVTRAASTSSGKKVGRNEPCPCGSGRKYKHCHGKRSQQDQAD